MIKILSIAVTSAALLTPIAVNAQDVCGASYIVLPGGRCMDMDYLSILGSSRELKAKVDAHYMRQLQANVTLDSSRTYRLTETEQERESRLKNLVDTSEVRDRVSTSNQRAEDALYPLHQQAMRRIGAAYSSRK